MNQATRNRIHAAIQAAADKASGQLGVFFYDLESGASAGHNENDIFPSASVFKIFVLAELVRQIRAGAHSFSDRHALNDYDKSEGSGVLQLMDNDASLTIKDYATLMMILSDNTAADFLFRLTGRDSIKAHVLDALDLPGTKCDLSCTDLIAACYQIKPRESLNACLAHNRPDLRNSDAFTGKLSENDETTPREAAEMLRQFYTGEWVDRDASDSALSIMKLCQTNARIPRYLPCGTEVAHKTGSMDRVANDVGIIYSPKGNYILSLFYNGNTASEEEYAGNDHNYFSEELLAHLSRDIYDLYVS